MAAFLVIGLGRFGSNLALHLMELGHEVMAVDRDEETVDEINRLLNKTEVFEITIEHMSGKLVKEK